jgi:GNAT superfamily N-acetyltransferase
MKPRHATVAAKVRFAATVGEEPEVEVALVQRSDARDFLTELCARGFFSGVRRYRVLGTQARRCRLHPVYAILRCRVSGGKPMQPRIRPFEDRDAEAVVDLSLRAWAPAFASLEQVLGSDIFRRQPPDWREDQRRAVEDVCATEKGRVWVAEVGGSAVGFVAVELHHPERGMGEISMLAVDSDYQSRGIGTALTEFALDRLKDAGMTVAMVETGETPGTPRRAARTRRPATSSCR